MSDRYRQGQGARTKWKESALRAQIEIDIKASRSSHYVDKFGYWALDLTCGTGHNIDAGCEGSPLVAARTLINQCGIGGKWIVGISDRLESSMRECTERLQRLIGSTWRSHLEFAPGKICKSIEYWRYVLPSVHATGHVFIDPNGYLDDDDVNALWRFSEDYPRLDVFLSINVGAWRRGQGLVKNGTRSHQTIRPENLYAGFHRKNCLIQVRPADGSNPYTYIFLAMRRWGDRKVGEHRREGFFDLYSTSGQLALLKGLCNARELEALERHVATLRDYRSYLASPEWKYMRRLVLERDGWQCVECKTARATEVHHIYGNYPLWGTFDVPENLESICHPCHCRLEGKPS
jgi:hypothetical protein